MSTKELAIECIRDLPDNASWRQIEEKIHFMSAVENAREEAARGETTPHQQVRELLSEWLSE